MVGRACWIKSAKSFFPTVRCVETLEIAHWLPQANNTLTNWQNVGAPLNDGEGWGGGLPPARPVDLSLLPEEVSLFRLKKKKSFSLPLCPHHHYVSPHLPLSHLAQRFKEKWKKERQKRLHLLCLLLSPGGI